ncbi:hypothetical protein UFOVP326_114 [uncultured Caudovirales phage]|uniref:Uncharacterized protein n=1 Tax=uncultured Caudovirales phage TaxID=2100421 RepID=A0A6J5LUS9_9CAUD|nr:hypothetical protein UFOVP326_114 [uncultured Caudovirales phage]
MTHHILTDLIRGIGPVIAGRVDGQPAYYMDVVDIDGTVRRCWEPKTRPRKGDPAAKRRCVLERIGLAQELRKQGRPVVLAHDQASFDGLVQLLLGGRREGAGCGPAESVNLRLHDGRPRP